MNAPTTLPALRGQQAQAAGSLATIPDQAVDMFTERGFVLANRIAKAFASSNAVPAQFQAFTIKKVGRDEHVVENPSAIGNCLVAIEVARAVGMSIVAVMQNADMIEGKLRWSGKFVIAAINASRRFTPLRFAMRKLGPIKASYKEKTGWDDQARRPVFTERIVEVEDEECIAWALPAGFVTPPGIYTLEQARAAGLPVIESAPVTMRMAVEEGWYGKPGSKWQTGLKALMFQYRAGSFFGNIHAPDIVMGMGPTSEEVRDTMTIDMDQTGQVVGITPEQLRQPAGQPTPMAEVVQPTQQGDQAQIHGQAAAAEPSSNVPAFDINAYADKLAACTNLDTLDVMADEIRGLENDGLINPDEAKSLGDVYRRRRQELNDGAPQAQQQTTQAAPQTTTRRRSSASGTAPE